MEDFIELGIEGIDKAVDVGFHKVPDRALHIHDPKKKQKKREQEAQQRSEEEGYDDDGPEQDVPRGTHSDPYDGNQYSEEEIPRQPYQRTQAHPSYQPHQYDDAIMTTPRSSRQLNRYEASVGRERNPNPKYYGPSAAMAGATIGTTAEAVDPRLYYQRPDQQDRYRTVSPPPYDNYGYGPQSTSNNTLARPPRRSRSSYSRPRDYNYDDSPPPKERRSSSRPSRPKSAGIDDFFSGSDYGLGALSLGTLAGGYAAYKIGKAKNVDPILAALAGGAVGGLGANAAEKQYEKNKKERETKTQRYKQKYGDPAERESGRRSRKDSY